MLSQPIGIPFGGTSILTLSRITADANAFSIGVENTALTSLCSPSRRIRWSTR